MNRNQTNDFSSKITIESVFNIDERIFGFKTYFGLKRPLFVRAGGYNYYNGTYGSGTEVFGREYDSIVEFDSDRFFMFGVVAGMVLVFILAQPYLVHGILVLTRYLYGFLPEQFAEFFWGQTLTAVTFFWLMIFVGFGLWLYRGDFFSREDPPESKLRNDPRTGEEFNGDEFD